jgi:hypothetical protein
VLHLVPLADLLETITEACARDTAWLKNQLRQQHIRQQREQQREQQQQQQRQQPGAKKQASKKQRQVSGNTAAAQLDAAAAVRIHMYLNVLPALAACCGDQLLTGPLAAHMEACVRLCWAVLQWDEVSSNSGFVGK